MGNERKDSFSTLDSLPDKSGIDLRQVEEDLGTRNKNHEVVFRKCCCNSSWCPACGLPSIRERMREIYMNWDYRNVRTYVLSVDRDLYESPLEAFLKIQRKKELSEFMKRVKRRLMKHGIIIIHCQGFFCLFKGKFQRVIGRIRVAELGINFMGPGQHSRWKRKTGVNLCRFIKKLSRLNHIFLAKFIKNV